MASLYSDFNNIKITDEDFTENDIQSIPGTTVLGNAEWLKERFDATAKQVLAPRINALIDELQTGTAADQIGSTLLTPSSGETVGAQLRYLLEQLNSVVLNQIPDGTVSDAKLSVEAGQIIDRVQSLFTDKAPLDSPALVGIPTAPTPPKATNSTQIATTEFAKILNADLSGVVSAHTGNTNIHVTAELKALWNRWNLFSPPALLWSGSWSSGSITVPDFDKYTAFKIGLVGNGTAILALRHQTDGTGGWHFRGDGGYSSVTPTINFYHFGATISGNTLTFAACNSFTQIPGAGHGPIGDTLAVNGIWGLC